MRLILLRHGETRENIDGIVQGWLNSTLNDTGNNQSRLAAENFHESIDAMYSSDLERCLQTAAFFRPKYPDIPFFIDRRLRERNFGDAQGTHKGLHNWEAFWASADNVSIPNAETLNDYNRRVSEFLRDIKDKHDDDETILVVTHGGTINRVLDILHETTSYKAIKNCETLTVTVS